MGYDIRIMEYGISDSDMDEVLFQSWLEERMDLWPGEGRSEEHIEEMHQILMGNPVDGGTESGLLVSIHDARITGFLEYSIKDKMPGTLGISSHIEGIHTNARYRRIGIGEALVNTLADISRIKGIKRITSDIEPWNVESIAFHYAVGFTSTFSDDESVFLEKIIG